MKISGPGRVQSGNVKKSSKAGKGDAAAFSRELSSGQDVDATSGVSGAGPISQVNPLLGLQEVPDSTESPSKGLHRANDMLDMLEEIRKGILLGAIPASRLRQLADMARGRQNQPQQDPRLAEILADIELRAEVELAKLGY
ncbi:flagellar assembly protein FliX [Temperatibacter marinus]|uniref:Flagellar assembly protein FliX n=1 Tax=Temperatibacter marinus TaxID=1456591 RepID=A0AA52H9S8_9PROT|nr:flagellar assembly protein FliX [Temperatibacter marinus]WND01913.1 flagellar assembly protein FliX [Temperatibacter marinus]